MLDEQQLSAGAEHARNLPEGGVGEVDRAEDERRDDRVHRPVLEWDRFGGGVERARRFAALAQLALQPPAHRLERLRQDQLLKAVGVVREVGARPAPISSVRPSACETSASRRRPMLRSSPRRIMRSYMAANTKSQRCSPWTFPAGAVPAFIEGNL